MKVSSTRVVAYDVLRDVEERDAYANLALPHRIRKSGLKSRDAAFVTELVSGTLRLQGRYDAILTIAAGRPAQEIDARTRRVLRLGVHQLLSMRVPTHAALNESVELQRLVANRKAAGFVNGVLRAITREDDWDSKLAASGLQGDALTAAQTSHPEWIVRALRDALRADGREEELEQLLHSDNVNPKVQFVVLDADDVEVDVVTALAEPAELTPTGISPIGLELTGGDPAQVIHKAGDVAHLRVQDQGSQLIALALARIGDPQAGERWLDLCAGPGGKTAVLAHEASAVGARLDANEVSAHRAELVRQALGPYRDEVCVREHDGRSEDAYGGESALYDRIMVDAPCSGLGALRRRPEARWRKQPSDLPELTQLQGELLDAAFAHLKPGGLLAYVTCSPHLLETRFTAQKFARRSGAEVIDARGTIRRIMRGEDPKLAESGDQPYVQLWPHAHHTDAMFLALFRRK